MTDRIVALVRLIMAMIAVLIVSLVTSRPASAMYIELQDGYLFIPNGLLLVGGVIILAVIIGVMAESSKATHASAVGLPKELRTSEPAEHYDDQAGRARALKRKLDAETDLAKSYLEAVRSKAELDDVIEFLDHDRAKRRAQR